MTRIHPTIMLASAALLSTIPAPGKSALFERDDRQYVPVGQGSPYSPVGMVSDDGLFVYRFATGFLVDDCHVLANQSFLGRGTAPLGKRAKFQTGIGTRSHQITKGSVVAVGGFERSGTPEERLGRNWLLLRLDKCLGASAGHVAWSSGPYSPFEFRDLKSAGYSSHRDRKSGLTVDPSCFVIGGRNTVWLNDCALVRGDGGAPVFRMSTSGGKPQMVVYAMQAGGVSYSGKPIPLKPGSENRAVPMSLIARQIERFLSVETHNKVAAAK